MVFAAGATSHIQCRPTFSPVLGSKLHLISEMSLSATLVPAVYKLCQLQPQASPAAESLGKVTQDTCFFCNLMKLTAGEKTQRDRDRKRTDRSDRGLC